MAALADVTRLTPKTAPRTNFTVMRTPPIGCNARAPAPPAPGGRNAITKDAKGNNPARRSVRPAATLRSQVIAGRAGAAIVHRMTTTEPAALGNAHHEGHADLYSRTRLRYRKIAIQHNWMGSGGLS